MKKYILGIFSLCIMFGGGWYYIHNSVTPTIHHHKHSTIDAYMDQVEILTMDENGNPKHHLITPKITHYKNNSADFIEPHVIVHLENQKPWHISADKGHAKSGIDIITLSGNVTIIQKKSSENPDTKIVTSSLTIYPKKQIAITKQKVTLNQPGVIIKSVGLKADLAKGKVELLSKAKAEYKL